MNKGKPNITKQQQGPQAPFNPYLHQAPLLPNLQNGPFIPQQYPGFQPMMNAPFSQGPITRPNPNLKN